MIIQLIFDGRFHGRVELLVGEAHDAKLASDFGVLLNGRPFRPEEGAEGVKAQEEVRLCHYSGSMENGDVDES